ncbi:MAG TPA: hypothetical protein VKG21_12425 [Casimicrobiaceae bacterium]|nr:hypothetical protein [Casimicrobiaceae bacterium]
MGGLATVKEALAFVEEHGVALASAKGPAPRLTEAIAGEPIRGNWWTHPQSRRIYAILAGVSELDQILVCRLINAKITLVHRRLWPSPVRLDQRFAPEQLAQVKEEHTASGRHISRAIPYPDWVPSEVIKEARKADEQEALRVLGRFLVHSQVTMEQPGARSLDGK